MPASRLSLYLLAAAGLAAMGLAVSGTIVLAADAAPQNGPDSAAMFAELDKNKDGLLSADEIPEEKRRAFERLLRAADKNRDGKLNVEEFGTGLKPRQRSNSVAANPTSPPSDKTSPADKTPGRELDRVFSRLDSNGDGKIAIDEVPAERRERFKHLIAHGDKDGDGQLNKAEFVAAIKHLAAGDVGSSKKGRDPAAIKRFFHRLDKNQDGKVTADEAPQERRSLVERLVHRGDTNGDKALTLEEFTAALQMPRPGKGQ